MEPWIGDAVSIDPHNFDDSQMNRELSEQIGDIDPEALERMASERPRNATPDEHGRVTGTVISIHNADVFVDIGAKSEGVVPLDEFEPDEPPVIGQSLSLIPHGFDKESGLMRLSLRAAKLHAELDSLRPGDVVKGRVTGSNIGGLELRVQGLRGFMPMSQVDLVRHEDFSAYMGRWLECEVTEIDRRGKNLVLSRRRVLEREREEERKQLRFQLADGQVRKGVVRRLTDFGAFVDLGGIDGLLHVSDMSYARINHPSEVVKVGDEIDVKILKVDLVKDRVSLGLKQLSADPWSLVEGKYKVGDTVEAKVVKLMEFGAFVQLEEGVEGLIPISEMSWTQRVHHPKEIVQVGDTVRVVALSVDANKRKISLSLKALGEDPWNGIAERYTPEAKVNGAVTRIMDFGAFVQLEDGVEGLVHISQLSDQRVRSVGDVVKVGDVVEVRVLSVDEKQRRISLSMKPTQEEQMEAQAAAEPVKPRKRKRELRGGLSF